MVLRQTIPSFALLSMAAACGPTEPSSAPAGATSTSPARETIAPAAATLGFRWLSATPESQGMCGSIKVLGCTRTLQQVWNGINKTIYNTKRFVVIRNDRVIFDRGIAKAYAAYSSSKGLLGAPTLVYAMSRCGVSLQDRASSWLGHGDGARWLDQVPWRDITVEQLASHTSGLCDYEDASTVCRDDSPGWQTAYDKARGGGAAYAYPNDLFTIARARAEQNREPAATPGTSWEYSNVGHALLNYVVQHACGLSLYDIYQTYIRQAGMGLPAAVPVISSDAGQVFNQSTGIIKWNGLDGASILRLATRSGIWDNRNVEPVRSWTLLTRITGNIPAAAALGWGVVYNNNSTDVWTATAGHRRFSPELFGHGGNYSNVFISDPLTGTIVVRQGENNAKGASYLTTNGCAPGWTGTAPTCTAGSNWSNNWNVSSGAVNFSTIGPRKKVVEPLQEAFFFPPPFCRLTSAAGQPVDATTDVYRAAPGDATIRLEAEITVEPREGAGSSVSDRIEFYKEGDGGTVEQIGNGTLVAQGNPARYAIAYDAEAHGAVGDVRTYFANCVARSTRDGTRMVPSYSRPVRVSR